MTRRAAFWAALILFAALLPTGMRRAAADPELVSWILLGGKGNAAKVAGLQLYAEPEIEDSIQLRLNTLTWAEGFIEIDEECPSTHFHGEVSDVRERGRHTCGLGQVARYSEGGVALRLASDSLMSGRRAQNALGRVAFVEARDAGQEALTHLLALREILRTPGPDAPPSRLLALARVNTAIEKQNRAVTILQNLVDQTSNLHAIRRAENALRGVEIATRRGFIVISGYR